MFRRVSALVLSLVVGSLMLAAGSQAAAPSSAPSAPSAPAAASPAPATPLSIADQLQLVQQQLDRLAGDVKSATERADKHGQEIEKLRNDVSALTSTVNEQFEQQRQLYEKLSILLTETSKQLGSQDEILRAISQRDSAGQPIPRLSANMQSSSEFRDEMRQVVNGSMSTSGKLTITNKTNDYHRIFVNRTEYGIVAGQALTLDVPAGTVSTQLPGRELKNWTIAGPRYEQSVEIVPDPLPVTTYTARPLYTVPTLGTVYYWPTSTY